MFSFSQALLLFVIILSVVISVLLFLKDKLKNVRSNDPNLAKKAIYGAYVSAALLILVQQFWDTSILYFILFPAIVLLSLIALANSDDSNRTFLIGLVLLLHLIVLGIALPTVGILITERTPALLKLDAAKSWNPEWLLLNTYYDPFPLDVGFSYIFSGMTGIEFADHFGVWLIFVSFVFAYDLTLYYLSKELSGNWKIGVLSVILLTFCPTTRINPAPQWIASLFVLTFCIGIVKFLKDSPTVSYAVIINLSFAMGMMFHGTAAIGAIILSIMLFLTFFGRKIGLNIVTTAYQRSLMIVTTFSAYVMTFARLVMIGGSNSVVFPLLSLLDSIFGTPEPNTWVGAEYVSIYDQSVSPITAYSWSLPMAFGIAFLIYHFVLRKTKKSSLTTLMLAFCIAAGVLSFGGLLGSMFMAHGNLQRYLGYSAVIFFIPVAAFVGYNLLKQSSVKFASIVFICIITFSGIGMLDPALSSQLYEINTDNPSTISDFIEGKTLYLMLPNGTRGVAPYEISVAFGYLSIEGDFSYKNLQFGGSLKSHRIFIENLVEQKQASPGLTYIWTPEILTSVTDVPVNVIYNSGRHVSLRQAN